MAHLFGNEITKEDFIDSFGKKALERYKKEQVLPSLIICQAILESGWGTSGIAETLYNYHGLNYYNDSVTKGYSFETRTTQQERNGVLVDSVENFCKFYTIDEELDCLYKWYNRDNKYYKALHGNLDALKNFELIKQSGYATDSGYTNKLTNIYNQYTSIQGYDRICIDSTFSSVTKKFYCVQTGAFRNKDYAINQTELLTANGFDSFIKEQDGYYKVQTGAFEIKQNAESQAEKLRNKGFACCIEIDYVAV